MYPYNLLDKKIEIFPIFWKELNNVSYLSMDDNSDFIKNLEDWQIKQQIIFQQEINKEFLKNSSNIIISWYLEKRLRLIWVLWHEQMINQERYFHLWIDLSVKKWTRIFAPLSWTIFETWYESWEWNYWGYIIIKHSIKWDIFYSLYWHLSYENIQVKKSDIINAWDYLGNIWDLNENWWYFHHLHLQVITEKWKENWFFSKWYCTRKQLENINDFVKDPSFIFKF